MSQTFHGTWEAKEEIFFRKPPAFHRLLFMPPFAGDIGARAGSLKWIAQIRKKEEEHEINERQRRYNKRKRKELEEKLEEQIREWNRGETERDEITENASKVLREGREATTELIRKVIRDAWYGYRKNKYNGGNI